MENNISRRFLLPATLASASAPVAVAASAEAAPGKAKGKGQRRWNNTLVPSKRELHFANRFAYGMTPSTLKAMRKAGSPEKWFSQQLKGVALKESSRAKALDSWWPDLFWNWQQLFDEYKRDNSISWVTMTNHSRYSLLKRVYTNRNVLESMTDFWENYLNIPVHDDSVFFFRANYGQTLRAKALGSFEDILYSAITHPAMSLALDNNSSHKDFPNENLGRELLELYTVGRGQYGETDVKNSAKILTGWTVDAWNTWVPQYKNDYHYVGAVKVMGFSHPNSSSDGREVTKAYLRYLAYHPATARKVCQALAVRFVKDAPSQALVNELASVYLKNDTQIKPVLKALIASNEFKRSSYDKVKTPADEIVSLYRIMGVKLSRPTGNKDDYAANQIIWSNEAIGLGALNWPRPDSPPDNQITWTSAGRLLASFEIHWAMAGGWWPKQGIKYQNERKWIPKQNMRFDELVDHMSRLLLGEKASSKTLKAACKALKLHPASRVNKDSGLYDWKMPILIAIFLDSPKNFLR